MDNPLRSDIARFEWKTSYRQRSNSGQTETGIEAIWRRVARACAAIGVPAQAEWAMKLRDAIVRHGICNIHLLAITPAGSISLLAVNFSTGIEPVFDFKYRHRIHVQHDQVRNFDLKDYALLHWREIKGAQPLPTYFVTATALPPQVHIAMQAAPQPDVDNAISKIINTPEDYSFAGFMDICREAYEQGLKGMTVYRPSLAVMMRLCSRMPGKNADCSSYADETNRTGH